MSGLAQADIKRMRDQLFFEGPERGRRLSRYWLLLPLSTVIASAGVVSDSTATVIGAMIVAPLMTPILGIVLAVVLADGANLRRCVLWVPKISSTSSDQAIFVDQATDARLPSDAVLLKVDRFG